LELLRFPYTPGGGDAEEDSAGRRHVQVDGHVLPVLEILDGEVLVGRFVLRPPVHVPARWEGAEGPRVPGAGGGGVIWVNPWNTVLSHVFDGFGVCLELLDIPA